MAEQRENPFKAPPDPEQHTNREVYLPYGLGCAIAANCFNCPLPNVCRFEQTEKRRRTPKGEWYFRQGFEYSKNPI